MLHDLYPYILLRCFRGHRFRSSRALRSSIVSCARVSWSPRYALGAPGGPEIMMKKIMTIIIIIVHRSCYIVIDGSWSCYHVTLLLLLWPLSSIIVHDHGYCYHNYVIARLQRWWWNQWFGQWVCEPAWVGNGWYYVLIILGDRREFLLTWKSQHGISRLVYQ